MSKRLAKKVEYESEDLDYSGEEERKEIQELKDTKNTQLFINDYTEKSIVITGDTISHSKQLKELGGSYNPKLKIGAGWIFSKARKESVENYIKTGKVERFQFDKSKFSSAEEKQDEKLEKAFSLLLSAFESDAEYDGEDVLETIKKVQKKIMK